MTGRGRPGHDHIDTCTLGSGAAVMTHPRIPTHMHAHTKPETSTYGQPKYNFPSSFMHQSKGCPNHLFSPSCRYFIAPKWLLLSSLPLHLFDWQMGEKTANGDRAGGQSWDCVSWARARGRARRAARRLGGWERQVRRVRALFKSLFKMPTEPTLAFPNGASQARHPTPVPVIPVCPLSLSVVT